MTSVARPILGRDEIDAYHRDGYLVPRYRLPAPVLQRLQALTLKLVADNPELADQHMVGPHIPGSGVDNLKSTDGWMDIATNPDLLDMMEQLVGPDLILWGTGVFHKRALKGTATPWHRDAAHTPIRPLATTTVWIAVFDSVRANGCLRVIPGSHRAKAIGEHYVHGDENLFLPAALDESEVEDSAAVDVELAAGQMVAFDMFTVHGSQPNQGTIPRAGYALRFMPTTCHYDHDLAVHNGLKGYSHDTRPLLLVRGVDRCGRNDFQRGHPRAALATPA